MTKDQLTDLRFAIPVQRILPVMSLLYLCVHSLSNSIDLI